jgi:hypothetical protein
MISTDGHPRGVRSRSDAESAVRHGSAAKGCRRRLPPFHAPAWPWRSQRPGLSTDAVGQTDRGRSMLNPAYGCHRRRCQAMSIRKTALRRGGKPSGRSGMRSPATRCAVQLAVDSGSGAQPRNGSPSPACPEAGQSIAAPRPLPNPQAAGGSVGRSRDRPFGQPRSSDIPMSPPDASPIDWIEPPRARDADRRSRGADDGLKRCARSPATTLMPAACRR